jgi:hypothetical protein
LLVEFIKHFINMINDQSILIGKQISYRGFPRAGRSSHPQDVFKLAVRISHHFAISSLT